MRRRLPYSGTIFAQVVDAYMNSPDYQKLRPHTKRTYNRFLMLAGRMDGLGSIPAEQMRPALVQAFLNGLADRPAAQQKAKTVLGVLAGFGAVMDLLPKGIMEGTKAPGGKGGHIPWTDEQVSFACTVSAGHLSCAVQLAANTGQRGSDLIRMRWTDIETHSGHPGINVVQQKTGLRIWVPFTQTLIAAIETWPRQPGMILRKANGLPYDNRQQLTDAWLREQERPEMEPLRGLVLHGLRGTAVVRLRRAGAEIPQICDMVGMSEQMVTRYCRFSDQKQNALAAVYRLDGVTNPTKGKITK